MHPPWRWYEKQDALKRRRRAGDLPDFYNICLERPKDDPGGFDVLFVDAAPAGSFASRLSHSCHPNCQAVVMAASGRLTIAVYTLRWIAPGEELTFDYSSTTESDAEYRAAVCLCGTSRCRGSFLYWTGSSGFQQVMSVAHTFLDRNALLVRAIQEELTDGDRARLDAFSLRTSALGGGEHGAYVAPLWLVKWAALILDFVELERQELPGALMSLCGPGQVYTREGASETARGVAENRLQNLVITLDKVKHFLRQPGQPQGPPLRALTAAETAALLWSAPDSVARRLVDTAAAALCSACRNAGITGAHATPGCGALSALHALCDVPDGTEHSLPIAVQRLLDIEHVLRSVDTSKPAGGRHAAAADLAHLYARTTLFFVPERYDSITSLPVTLRPEEIGVGASTVDTPLGTIPCAVQSGDRGDARVWGAGARSLNAAAAAAAAQAATSIHAFSDVSEADAAGDEDDWWVTDARTGVRFSAPGSGELVRSVESTQDASLASGDGATAVPPHEGMHCALAGVPLRKLLAQAAPPPSSKEDESAAGGDPDTSLELARSAQPVNGVQPVNGAQPVSGALQEAKRYRPAFAWGQLVGWFKQTVLDPTASLSADRRGTISLPDVESSYGKYSLKDRQALLSLVSDTPGAQWPTGALWSFKNTARAYGSPMLDAAIARQRGEEVFLPTILDELTRAVGPPERHLPLDLQRAQTS